VIEAAIFDLDGVILDAPALASIVLQSIRELVPELLDAR
jgi:beta-phosphoglucomutase-like phosphatase (HAD superfamily)